MKVSGRIKPEKQFRIIRNGPECRVEFFTNIVGKQIVDGMTGLAVPSWEYEKYTLNVSYSPNLGAEIETHFQTWLQKAKDAETEIEKENIRRQRDELLNMADLKYCNSELWARMSSGQKQAWAMYKQALRDIPIQKGFPYATEWPQIPNAK